jgi:hypothetical protein
MVKPVKGLEEQVEQTLDEQMEYMQYEIDWYKNKVNRGYYGWKTDLCMYRSILKSLKELQSNEMD